MSVPTWKRKLSSAEFVYQTFQLCIRIGEIMVNKPQKYKVNYTDDIVKTSLEALKHLQIADSIFMSKYTKEEDYLLRRKHLLLGKGLVEHVATSSYVFLELVRKHDFASEGENNKYYSKLYDQEIEIGDRCENCHKLISGVIKSDSELYNKYIKNK